MMNAIVDFFLSTSAFQNYFSELIGIAITVFGINWYLKKRENKRNLPTKNVAHSLIWTTTDRFISDFLPTTFRQFKYGTIYFGNYFNHSFFIIKDYKTYELRDLLERFENSDIRLAKNKDVNDSLSIDFIDDANLKLAKIKNFDKDLTEFYNQYGKILDQNLLDLMSNSSHIIKKHFQTYSKKVDSPEDLEHIHLYAMIPELIANCIKIKQILINERSDK